MAIVWNQPSHIVLDVQPAPIRTGTHRPVPGRKGEGCTVVLYSFLNNKSLYCANSIVANSSNSIGCAEDTKPFTINSGDVITNRALLAKADCSVPTLNQTAANSGMPSSTATPTSSPDKDNSDPKTIAVGVGVGIPLGILAVFAFGWALYERKQRYLLINSHSSQMMEPQPYTMEPKPVHISPVPQELGDENR
ncbi:uncharacterized protein GIQ15_00711 [Arthroderma uncinatum]|uniref:uncharacterized protein n=1 Tax=Arthroderma uncinatum TaxID=74035 RepID=UPI00144AA233|nr:uncharacterized protein GIQ15_00711 [Arthroderma uncinatum]KAF3491194.1 hypothetical protein GIQ15_00711 [Arthroderma uncinatum]